MSDKVCTGTVSGPQHRPGGGGKSTMRLFSTRALRTSAPKCAVHFHANSGSAFKHVNRISEVLNDRTRACTVPASAPNTEGRLAAAAREFTAALRLGSNWSAV